MEGFPKESPPVIENAENEAEREKIKELSELLEAASKNNEEIHVTEEALAAPEKVALLYDAAPSKYKAFLGALVFAFASEAVAAPPVPETREEGASGQVTLEKKRAEAVASDFIKKAQELGLSVETYAPLKAAARTIVHFGQTHDTVPEINYKYREEIAKSQASIASMLGTAPRGMHVFVEGYSGESAEKTIELRETAELIKAAVTPEAIMETYLTARKGLFTDDRSAGVLNKITGDKLVSLGFKEISPSTYAKGSDVMTLYQTGFFPREKRYSVPNEAESSLAGAANILDAHGGAYIYPAETSDANYEPFKLRNMLTAKGAKLGEIFLSLSSARPVEERSLPNLSDYSSITIEFAAKSDECRKNAECRQLAKEIMGKDIPALVKATFGDREDVAVKLIAGHASTTEQAVFPLVYGAAHDFTYAVMKWNLENPTKQFNLVTIGGKQKLK